jgi:hypothetical protein
MKQTAVEWLAQQINTAKWKFSDITDRNAIIEQAKEMERKERLKYQLFIGKVDEILGFDKTLELLKECNNKIL